MTENGISVHKLAAAKVPAQRRPHSGPVETVTVRPDVLKAAVRAAGGDRSLLRIDDARHVRVLDSRYDPPR